VNDHDIRAAHARVAALRRRLAAPASRCPKREAIHLIGLVERLAAGLAASRTLNAEQFHYRELYDSLARDWNGVARVIRDVGIEVGQRADQRWHWCYDGRTGSAPTVAEAYAAALAAAGAVRVEP
jgi:hypothetical protein